MSLQMSDERAFAEEIIHCIFSKKPMPSDWRVTWQKYPKMASKVVSTVWLTLGICALIGGLVLIIAQNLIVTLVIIALIPVICTIAGLLERWITINSIDIRNKHFFVLAPDGIVSYGGNSQAIDCLLFENTQSMNIVVSRELTSSSMGGLLVTRNKLSRIFFIPEDVHVDLETVKMSFLFSKRGLPKDSYNRD